MEANASRTQVTGSGKLDRRDCSGVSRAAEVIGSATLVYTRQNSHIFHLVYSMSITPQILCVKGVENKRH